MSGMEQTLLVTYLIAAGGLTGGSLSRGIGAFAPTLDAAEEVALTIFLIALWPAVLALLIAYLIVLFVYLVGSAICKLMMGRP